MGVKALLAYFYGVVDRNKDTDVQFIFDTYDDVVEGVNKKMDGYSTKLSAYNTKLDNGEELTSKEEKYKRAYENNLKALSQVQVGCDSRLTTIASCDNLVALYSKNLEANRNNGKWLQRAVSRMYNKDCTDADIYVSLVDAYQIASPSPEASVFYAGVLLKNGEKSKATQYFKQAIEQETDPNKKAKYLMKVANLSSKTDKVAARRAAKQAIALKPGYGQAYLLIADLYAKSANSCGSNVFEKKMTYVAALNYASRAKRLDPAISKVAQKYINNYRQQIPDKTMVFTSGMQAGTNYTIKCWINETVTIP
jgi:Tfp pilus assembly protein PilF